MGITATAKAKIFIGSKTYATGSNPSLAIADYTTGETYTQINEVSDLGEFGDSVSEIKFESVSDSRVFKVNGTRDAGDMSLVVARDAGDAGQGLARSASKDDFNRSYKIVMNDAPNATGTGTTFYFRALSQSATNKFSGPNNVVMTTFKLAINSDILEVAPVAGT